MRLNLLEASLPKARLTICAPRVGAGGHVTHGGYGMSTHTKGLALDWLLEATVVLANSTVVTASSSQNADLFWALRGAGSSIGIVTEFKFATFEAPEKLTRFNVVLPWNASSAVAGLKTLQGWAEDEMPAEMNARIFLNSQIPNIEGLYYGGREEALPVLEPLIEDIGGMLQDVTETDWLGQLDHFGHCLDLDQTHPYNKVSSRMTSFLISALDFELTEDPVQQDNMYSTSIYTDSLTDSQLESLVDYWYRSAKTVRRGWYHHIDFHGGRTSAVSAVDVNSTSYAHRDKLLLHNFYDRVDIASEYPDNGFDLLDGFIDAIVGDGDRLAYGAYFNYPDPRMEREEAETRYWGDALPLLRKIKATVDPDEVFYLPQSVSPAKENSDVTEVETEAPKDEPEEPVKL